MPPEIYNGPLWLEAIGALGVLGLVVIGPLKLVDYLDRKRERDLDRELGSSHQERADRRARYGR